MSQHKLSLAEKRFLLSSEVEGGELLKMSLLDCIFIGVIEYQPNRSNDRDLRLDSFLKLNDDGVLGNGNKVYEPIIEAFSGLSRVQISLFLKKLYKNLENLSRYKIDYVQQNLKDASLVESSVFNKLLGKIELTAKGEQERAELIKEVQKGKDVGKGDIGVICTLLTSEHFEDASNLGIELDITQKNDLFFNSLDQFEFLMENLLSGELLEPLNLDLSFMEGLPFDIGLDFGDSFSFIELF